MTNLITKPRRNFDIRNKQDVELYRKFMMTNKWGPSGCPFELEYPFLSVPSMIDRKLLKHFLKIKDSYE